MISELYKPQGIEGKQLHFSVTNDKETNRRFIMTTPQGKLELPIPLGYGPPRGGLFLTHNLGEVEGKTFCDLGAGFFAINTIAAKLLGAKMSVGLEKNLQAVKWANALVQNCGLENTYVLCADTFCFSPEIRFDVVVGNLPMMPTNKIAKLPEDYYHYGGTTGWEVIDSYLSLIPQFLNHGSYIRLLLLDFLGIDQRTSPNISSAFERLHRIGLEPSIIASLKFHVDQEHPFKKVPGLFSYINELYPQYNFSQDMYKTVIVEGKNI